MAITSLVQGIVETEDGKVFELESPKGSAWLESISSFRFEPSNGSKPYTVRKESGIYWYGCRKIAGKVRKKYIGKSPEVTVAKLEEIAAALEIPSVPQNNKVVEVVQVTQEVAQDRLTALELQVAKLQKAVEVLQDALPGKLKAGDSLELPKVDSEVAEQLQNELGNLKAENEKLRADYAALLESSTAVTNKLREEVQEVRSQLEAEKTSWDELREELDDSEGTCAKLRSQLATEHSSREPIETELARLAADREELAQLKKWAKKHADELHREENSMKLEKVRWQRELGDARAELADAKATMLNQSNKIRELERGFSLKPNPAESRLRLEIGELQTQLSELKQKSASARKDFPDAATILSQLRTRRKKSKTDLGDVEMLLEILEPDTD